jgi:hypothetical protein
MRHCIAVLLLVLLPLQFSWAVVADYCQHDAEIVTDHLGHHDHASHAPDNAAGKGKAKAGSEGSTSASADIDCGHCHGHCAAVLAAPDRLEPQPPGSAPPTLGELPGAEHTPAQPDRPQWASLA